MDNTPVLQFVKGHVLQQTIFSFVILYSVYLTIKGMLSILALRKQLKNGVPINHHAPWKKNLRRSAILNIVFIMIAFGSAYLPFKQLFEMDTITLPVEVTNHKVVRLAELEQLPDLKREEYYIDGINWANRLSTNWSIVAPIQYEIDESGETYISTASNEKIKYNPSLSSEVYELRMTSLVEPLVQDLITWYSYHTKTFIKKQNASLDYLYIYEEEMYRNVVAAKGNVVTFVSYSGNATTNVLIEKIAEKLNE